MKGQPNRLAAATAGPFIGSAIDRNRPLQFRLDGRSIDGFVGDTVLSAVLAAGIDTLGQRPDGPVALSAASAPAIIAASLARDRQRALPMAQTPATAGAEYLTLAPGARHGTMPRRRLRLAAGNSLGLTLPTTAPLPAPWMHYPGAAETPAEVIIVGGGVAGLSAAVAAAAAGLSVTVLEAGPCVGGSARLFGTLDGEETAEASLLRLNTAIAGADNITVLTHARVVAARAGAVRVHIIDKADTMPSGRVVDLQARHIILATGAAERLPVFAGNRLPGTVGVREAYDLASRYGVWSGQSALLATSSNVAYRLAMLARDAGIAVPRIIDSRPQPQSRFVEYSKAYGMTLAAGTIIAEARRGAQGRGLAVTPRLEVDRFSRDEAMLQVDRLVLCGGWQPDLDLWHMAGGDSRWNSAAQRLEPAGGPDGLVLAGNAAGYRGHHACLASGAAAIDLLLGRPVGAVAERDVDPIYETPDGATPIAAPPARPAAATFLGNGRHGVTQPQAPASRWPTWMPLGSRPVPASLVEGPMAMGAVEVAAGVLLGAIPPRHAGQVARERVAMVAMQTAAPRDSERPAPPPLLPAFLVGRFGADAQVWLIAPAEPRTLEPGALIQANADVTDAAAAVGVVLRQAGPGVVALIAGSHARAGQTVTVREVGRAITVRLTARYNGEEA